MFKSRERQRMNKKMFKSEHKNAELYNDPTAGAALRNVSAEERKVLRARREAETRKKKVEDDTNA